MPDGNQFLDKHRPRQHTHIELVLSIRGRDRDRLDDWDKNFLTSIVQYDNPTPRQMEVLKAICAKALVQGNQKQTPRRKRRAAR